MAKKKRSIVLCKDYNGNKNVLFMMDNDDSRCGTSKYAMVTGGQYVAVKKMFVGDNGVTYQVFSDWSARVIPAANVGESKLPMGLQTRVTIQVMHPKGFARFKTDRGAKFRDPADIQRVTDILVSDAKRIYGTSAKIVIDTHET